VFFFGANRLGFIRFSCSRFPSKSPDEKSAGFSLQSGLARFLFSSFGFACAIFGRNFFQQQ
jgi:hypothetical protein